MRLKRIRRRGEEHQIEVDMDSLYDEQWRRIDDDLKARIIGALQRGISLDDQQSIAAAYDKYGPHVWMHKEPFDHMFYGMAVRNWLRVEGGIRDAELPPFDSYYGEGTDVRNWDDYYVQALEALVGRR